jgi:hypothetical protein
MTTDPNEGPVWPSENPSDRPTPSSEPVYPPSAANEPPPPPEQASPEPPGTYAPPPPPPPVYGGTPQGYPPPPPAPGYAAPGYGAQAVTQVPVPAGINGLWQKFINVTTKPGAQSFTNELPTANWSDIWIALLGLGVVTALAGLINGLIFRAATGAANNPFLSGLPPDQQRVFGDMLRNTGTGFGSLFSIIWVPIAFFIGMGIWFVSAKIFGGTGSFLNQAYAFMLYTVPIQGAAAILGIVPILGGLAGFALTIYGFVLAVFAMMASQRLSGGRAAAAVFLPAIIVALLFCALFFVIIAAIVGAANAGR